MLSNTFAQAVASSGMAHRYFVHRITHEGTGEDCLAVCQVVMRREGFLDEVTTMTLKLQTEDPALVVETKEERRLNHNVLRGERDAVRWH